MDIEFIIQYNNSTMQNNNFKIVRISYFNGSRFHDKKRIMPGRHDPLLVKKLVVKKVRLIFSQSEKQPDLFMVKESYRVTGERCLEEAFAWLPYF
jgi:hypothetical protein